MRLRIVRIIALHRIRLARRRLPVRENRPVVSLHHLVEDGFGDLVVDDLLRAVLENVIEFEVVLVVGAVA